MRKSKSSVKLLSLLLCLLLCFMSASLVGCGIRKGKAITCLDDMKDRKLTIGCPDDLNLNDRIHEICPQAQIMPVNDIMAIESVLTGKLDGFIAGEYILNGYLEQHPDSGLTMLDEPVIEFNCALGLSESTPLDNYVQRVNACIAKLKEDGTFADMERRWLVEGDETMPQIEMPEDPAYTLRVATFGQQKPNTYFKDNQLVGFDVELAYRVAAELGCGIKLDTASFASMLLGTSEGKYDMIASDLYVTGERTENLTFSDPYKVDPVCIVVRGDTSVSKVYSSYEDLKQAKRFGSITGSISADITRKYYPDAQIIEYNSLMDVTSALSAGKIDAYLFDKPVLDYISSEHSDLKSFDEPLVLENYHFFAAKNADGKNLIEEFNVWLAKARKAGILDDMEAFWIGTADPENRMKIEPAENPKGMLRVAITPDSRPDTYYFNNEPAGFSPELVLRFCKDSGYEAEFVTTEMDSYIPVVASGKVDLCCGFLSYTEERAQNVIYSDTIYSGGISALVRRGSKTEGVWDKTVRGFTSTFVKEQRWKMLLSGLGQTAVITLGGFALANLMGMLFCALSMSKRKICRVIADVYSRIMQGTPVVVILMIFYYIIFGKSRISGTFVAILGFGISSGAGMAQLFYGGISAVEKGQKEASLALGFTELQTFFGIVLPQAVRTMLPGWFSSLIALMKGTAIVGYVAVVDLTKASDIIRSATYEAFFPLIAVAAVYFLIACLLLSLLKAFQKKLEPKRVTAGSEVKNDSH